MNASLQDFVALNKFKLAGLVAVTSFIYLTKRFYFNGGRFHDRTIKLEGKTVIITGASAGIGKYTALDLAKRGARVIMACRDVAKASKVADEIRSQSGNGNVFVVQLDLASLDSVRAFATKINAEEERIDILINNAGKIYPI